MDIKEAVLAIGRNGRLVTQDGWIAEVEITDATVAYGQVRLGVWQDQSKLTTFGMPREKFVDASRVEIVND